jgi:hypothetical protein
MLVGYLVPNLIVTVALLMLARRSRGRRARVALLAAWGTMILALTIAAPFVLPSVVFGWYERGWWPTPPLGERTFTLDLGNGDTLGVRGHEIRVASEANLDWVWDLQFRGTGGLIGSGQSWSGEDTLPLRIVRDGALVAVVREDAPEAFLVSANGQLRGQRFRYPFLNNEQDWRNVAIAMRASVEDIRRLHEDLANDGPPSQPEARIVRYDLGDRSVEVRFEWERTIRLVHFTIDSTDGTLRLVSIDRMPLARPSGP